MSLKEYFKKTEGLRQSMEEIVPKFVKEFKELDEGETYIDRINKKLLSYQEIKYVYKKTRIKPFYYLIFLRYFLRKNLFISIYYFGIIVFATVCNYNRF